MMSALEQALAGHAAPWLICLALALTTLLLEDVAIAAGVALSVQGTLSWTSSVCAVASGIALGDLGLYVLGLVAHRVPWIRRRHVDRVSADGSAERLSARWRGHLMNRLGLAVFLARVIPGLRLLTYTACGFLRVPWGPFAAWVLLAVAVWTVGLYAISWWMGDWIARHTGWPLPLAVALPALGLALLVPMWRAFSRRRTAPRGGFEP